MRQHGKELSRLSHLTDDATDQAPRCRCRLHRFLKEKRRSDTIALIRKFNVSKMSCGDIITSKIINELGQRLSRPLLQGANDSSIAKASPNLGLSFNMTAAMSGKSRSDSYASCKVVSTISAFYRLQRISWHYLRGQIRYPRKHSEPWQTKREVQSDIIWRHHHREGGAERNDCRARIGWSRLLIPSILYRSKAVATSWSKVRKNLQ